MKIEKDSYSSHANSRSKELVSVAYFGSEANLYAEVQRLGDLAGVHVERATVAQQIRGVLNFNQSPDNEHEIIAYFDQDFVPYFRSDRAHLNVKTQTSEILDLLVAVGATVRGKIIGVIGAQGGVGATSLSIWIARELSQRKNSVALIDMCPVPYGLDMYFSGVEISGNRWPDLIGDGALLAGRLNDSLPQWKGIRVLSADERGGVSLTSDLGVKAISALSQVNQYTVIDLPREAVSEDSPTRASIEWCDVVVMLCRGDELSVVQAQLCYNALTRVSDVLVVISGSTSQGLAAHIASRLRTDRVFTVRRHRGMVKDMEHGVAIGDSSKTRAGADVRTLVDAMIGRIA